MSHQDPIIEVQIDELVLRGFPPANRFRIAEAFQNELTRLFAENSRRQTQPRALTIHRTRAGPLKISQNAPPAAIGAQLAQSVYRHVAPSVFKSRGGRVYK